MYRDAASREAIRAVGLEGYERREPHTLSGGEKQRVALASSSLDPEVLLLDEPTSMLDAAGRAEVLERLEALRGSRTVVHVTHHLDELLGHDRARAQRGKARGRREPRASVTDPVLLRENRLALPTTLRLAAALGLGPAKVRTPEGLAEILLQESLV